MEILGPRSRLALLLERFGEVRHVRAAWRVAYPLREVLFLVVCVTMALVRRFAFNLLHQLDDQRSIKT